MSQNITTDGKDIVMEKFCVGCGAPLEGPFCTSCGQKAEIGHEAQPVQPMEQVDEYFSQFPVQQMGQATPQYTLQDNYSFPQQSTQPSQPHVSLYKSARKSKKGLIVGIIITACLLVGGAVAAFFVFDPFSLTGSDRNRGNSAGNIVNLGVAATDGKKIYYINDYDFSIFSVNMDGSDNTRLNDMESWFINVLDGWLYFALIDDYGIYKMRTDGSNLIKISDDEATCVTVVGNKIYYINRDDDNIYSIDTDGKNTIKISNDSAGHMSVSGNRIYYTNLGDDYEFYYNYFDGKIYSIKTDGSDRQALTDDVAGLFCIENNTVYYINKDKSGQIYSIKTNGSSNNPVGDFYANELNVSGGVIYYTCTGEFGDLSLSKVNTNGNGNQQLNNEETYNINIINNRIIFITYDDDWNVIFNIMNKDGTNNMTLNEFTGFSTAQNGHNPGDSTGEIPDTRLLASLIREEFELLRDISRLQELNEWFKDEENQVKYNRVSWTILLSILLTAKIDEIYITINESLNEYILINYNFEPHYKYDHYAPYDRWYFDFIDSDFLIQLHLGEDTISNEYRLWMDYKIIDNGNVLGIVTAKLHPPDDFLPLLDLDENELNEILSLVAEELFY